MRVHTQSGRLHVAPLISRTNKRRRLKRLLILTPAASLRGPNGVPRSRRERTVCPQQVFLNTSPPWGKGGEGDVT